jgi:BioD-like phosphotransacetylase family protein
MYTYEGILLGKPRISDDVQTSTGCGVVSCTASAASLNVEVAVHLAIATVHVQHHVVIATYNLQHVQACTAGTASRQAHRYLLKGADPWFKY